MADWSVQPTRQYRRTEVIHRPPKLPAEWGFRVSIQAPQPSLELPRGEGMDLSGGCSLTQPDPVFLAPVRCYLILFLPFGSDCHHTCRVPLTPPCIKSACGKSEAVPFVEYVDRRGFADQIDQFWNSPNLNSKPSALGLRIKAQTIRCHQNHLDWAKHPNPNFLPHSN